MLEWDRKRVKDGKRERARERLRKQPKNKTNEYEPSIVMAANRRGKREEEAKKNGTKMKIKKNVCLRHKTK